MSADAPGDHGGYVVLTEAPNLHRAHLVAGALEAAGIPASVEEDHLVDEWAMAQKLMGAMGVRVLVPGAQLDEARTIFLGLSQPIPLVDEEFELGAYDTAHSARRGRLAVLGLMVFLSLPVLFWLTWLLVEYLD